MIDVNVSLSRWPFRRLPDDEPERLAARLRSLGVTEAWAGNFDALLHRDFEAVNARTADLCGRFGDGLFHPVGAIDPTLPDWPEELRRCAEVHQMRAIRAHPNYHGYGLDHPAFADLLDEAGRRGLIAQIAVRMEDERGLHPLLKNLPPTDLAPLVPLLNRPGRPKIVVLNALKNAAGGGLPRPLLEAENVWFDTAMLEGMGGLGRLVDQLGVERLLYGSHAPFFVAQAAKLKFTESPLSVENAEAIQRGNAQRLLGR